MYRYYLVTFPSNRAVIYRTDPMNLALGLQYLHIDTINVLDLMLRFKSNTDLAWHGSSYCDLEDLKIDAKSITLIQME